MKAVWFEKKGPAREVLVVGEMPDPEPGPGEVRVRVAISGVNPTDTKTRGAFGGNMTMEFPRVIPGHDAAGVIDRVGQGVPPSRIGERVWVWEAYLRRPFGTAAEYTCLPTANAVKLPDYIDDDTAASLGIVAMTAHRCLFADGGIQGKTVLVHGGGGGVGNSAIQLARWAGAHVITTVSRTQQAEAARAAGAHQILNRKEEDVAAAVKQAGLADRIVDIDFGQNLDLNLSVIKTGGTISSYFSSPYTKPFPFLPMMRMCVRVDCVLVYTMGVEAHMAAVRDVSACLAARAYKAHVGARFPLAELAAAHEAQDSGQVVGKILVDI